MTAVLTPSSALKMLQEKKIRLTKARRAVVDILLQPGPPLSAQDVLVRLKKKGLRVNKVTAYRELAFLEGMRLIEAVQFADGIRRFTRAQGHHHHLICTECKTVTEVELPHDLDDMEKTIRRKTDFTIERHALEFYGRCRQCT